MSDIWVRRFVETDADVCVKVMKDAVSVGAAKYYSYNERLAWIIKLPNAQSLIAALKTDIIFVADVAEVCGLMSLSGNRIDLAYVSSHKCGNGVANVLYAAILNSAKLQGITRLHTNASHMARSFFVRHGWQLDQPETIKRAGQSLQRYQMSFQI